MPNDDSLGQVNGRGWAKDGRSDGIGRVSINQIEQLLGGDIDLLKNIPNEAIKENLKAKVYHDPYAPYLNSRLLANDDALIQLSEGSIRAFDNVSTSHDSVFVKHITADAKLSNGVEETGVSKNSTTSISPGDISPFQVGAREVGSSKPSVTQISSFEVSPSEVGVIELSPLQVSPRQINSGHIDFVRQTDINEVSLTPSVPFPQFFNRNSGSEEFSGNFQDFLVFEVEFGFHPKVISNVPPSSHSSLMFDRSNNRTGHDFSPLILDLTQSAVTQILSF